MADACVPSVSHAEAFIPETRRVAKCVKHLAKQTQPFHVKGIIERGMASPFLVVSFAAADS